MYSQHNAAQLTKRFCLASAALALACVSVAAQAQVSFEISDESVSPGGTVEVTWTYTGDGNADAIEGRFDFSNADITSVDYSNCTASWSGGDYFSQCLDQGGTEDNVFFQILHTAGDPLPDGTGTIVFEVDGGAAAPQTLDLIWDQTAFVVAGGPTVNSTNGSIEFVSGPQSELSLTPDPMAFGTVDLGNMPATDSFTLENVGAADAEITGVSLAGPDAEFTIAADNCSGTLAAGASCTVDIQFDSGANGSFSNQLDITSDANVNPNPSAGITGSADSVADLSVNPAFGPVDLGTVVIGSSSSANGSVSNDGSADGSFSCSLSGDPAISVSPSPLAGTVPAGGSSDFSLTCSVPDTAAEGDTFSATLECTGDNGFSGTHEVSCGATEFVAIPVPTTTKWGLAVLALLMVMIGGLTVRFFRT